MPAPTIGRSKFIGAGLLILSLMSQISIASGVDKWAADTVKKIDLDAFYNPFPKQQLFHQAEARNKGFGGSAGPGKTAALILDQVMSCYEHEGADALKVQTTLVRRTHPQLAGSLIPRFRSLVPPSLYRKATLEGSKKEVVWLNGARTRFGSMQHDKSVWDYQGQENKEFGFDEATQFTWYQFSTVDPWVRCPVGFARKSGATNPVGAGAIWFKKVFVDHKPCPEMDDSQKAKYRPEDYAFIPALVQDNPVYANDPDFWKALDGMPARLRAALLEGRWDIALGAYYDCWDEAVMVYDDLDADALANYDPLDSTQAQPMQNYWPRWIGMDWGFEHPSAIYWLTTEPSGRHRVYRELVINHTAPKELAEMIAKLSLNPDGSREKIAEFHLAFDAHAKKQDAETIAVQMGQVFQKYKGMPAPQRATTDKVGREQLCYELLNTGALVVNRSCEKLIEVIPLAPRDEKKPEQIAKFNGDDPLDGFGYAVYGRLKKLGKEPRQSVIKKAMQGEADPTVAHIKGLIAAKKFDKARTVHIPKRFRGGVLWKA